MIVTKSTYATADTIKRNQKSSFDMLLLKDDLKGMKSYELSLQWRNSDGTDEYIENAKIHKTQNILNPSQ